MSWHVGDTWVANATVTKPGTETPEKPGGCTYVFLAPSGKETTVTPTETSTGKFEGQAELTEPGFWKLSVSTTAPWKAATSAEIRVLPKFGE